MKRDVIDHELRRNRELKERIKRLPQPKNTVTSQSFVQTEQEPGFLIELVEANSQTEQFAVQSVQMQTDAALPEVRTEVVYLPTDKGESYIRVLVQSLLIALLGIAIAAWRLVSTSNAWSAFQTLMELPQEEAVVLL
jgi:hypothetical protein